MSGKNVFLFIFALLIAGLAFLTPAWFQRAGSFLTFGLSAPDKITSEELSQELAASRISVTEPSNQFVAGDVFSLYPLNLKDQLLVDVGSAEGVKLGGAAISDGILVGKVVNISAEQSIVQTVFDPNFSMTIRIGQSMTDALLKGGVEPKLTLIPKTSTVVAGDAVYSASPSFEYGLPLGVLGPVVPATQNIFSEADLILSYSPVDLRYLFLEKQ